MKKFISLLLSVSFVFYGNLLYMYAKEAVEETNDSVISGSAIIYDSNITEIVSEQTDLGTVVVIPENYTGKIDKRLSVYAVESSTTTLDITSRDAGCYANAASDQAYSIYKEIIDQITPENIYTDVNGQNVITVKCDVSNYIALFWQEQVSEVSAELQNILSCDHPELFWLSGAMRFNSNKIDILTTFTQNGGTKNTDKDTVLKQIETVDAWKDETIEKALEYKDSYSQQKFLNSYLCDCAKYGYDDDPSMFWHTYKASGIPMTGRAVCAGYSATYKMLLDELGIKNTIMKSDNHAWNCVQMEDGKWYQTDVTWNDDDNSINSYYYDPNERNYYLLVGENVIKNDTVYYSNNWYKTKSAHDEYVVNLNIDLAYDNYAYNSEQSTEPTTETPPSPVIPIIPVIPTPEPVTDITTVTKGDTNGDGKLSRADLTRLNKYFAGWDVEISEDAADVTGDGKVSRADLTRLNKYFAGWDVQLG